MSVLLCVYDARIELREFVLDGVKFSKKTHYLYLPRTFDLFIETVDSNIRKNIYQTSLFQLQ